MLSDSVEGDFGDSRKMGLNGRTAEHKYCTAGTYNVMAVVILALDEKTCSHEPTISVYVNQVLTDDVRR